jgi:hypothetical protein
MADKCATTVPACSRSLVVAVVGGSGSFFVSKTYMMALAHMALASVARMPLAFQGLPTWTRYTDGPVSGHAEMHVNNMLHALGVEERKEVLAVRFNRLEHGAVDESRARCESAVWTRRRKLFAHQSLAVARSDAVHRVALDLSWRSRKKRHERRIPSISRIRGATPGKPFRSCNRL